MSNMNSDTTNEVARLRNELQGLKHAAQAVVDRWETPLWKDAEPTASVIYRLRDALAPVPEETRDGATMAEWYGGFAKIEITEPEPRCEAGILSNHQCKNKATLVTNSGYKCCKHHAPCISAGKWRDDVVPLSEKTTQVSDKEPVSDWQELGDDEVICEGDEEMHKEQTSWFPIEYNDDAIGTNAGIWSNFRFRTRRSLPKQEMPLEKAPDDLHAWMRLQETINLDIASDLQALRDQIEQLKQNQK